MVKSILFEELGLLSTVWGWWIAGFVILLFFVVFVIEYYRISCIKKWCHVKGFEKIFPLTSDMKTRLRQSTELFGHDHVLKWGHVLSNTTSEYAITVVEYDLEIQSDKKRWVTLIILKHFGTDLSEFRLANTNQVTELLGRVITLPIYPFKFIGQKIFGENSNSWNLDCRQFIFLKMTVLKRLSKFPETVAPPKKL